jgi:hypothetical protein
MSVIQAAEKYAEMEKSGLTIAQISAKTGVDPAAIQERLQLLTLTPDEQDKVKNNKISHVQALKLCEQRKRAVARPKASDDAPLQVYEP